MSTTGIGPAAHNFDLENGGVGNPLQRYHGGVGPQFLESKDSTSDVYIHPNDDTLGLGKNPMRETQSMSLNVTFGPP
jgi:hypothetical protein